MAAQGPSALPPTTIISSRPISQSAAHDFLAAYLDRAATDPALQPNAGISEHGPLSRTTAAAPNLMLHNLKRVQAGLAGEVLGRDLTLAKLMAGEDGDAQQQTTEAEQGQDWEDAQKFQQEGEALEDSQDPMDADVNMEQDQEGPASGAIDKEERKRLKKERRLAEKRAKAKADTDA